MILVPDLRRLYLRVYIGIAGRLDKAKPRSNCERCRRQAPMLVHETIAAAARESKGIDRRWEEFCRDRKDDLASRTYHLRHSQKSVKQKTEDKIKSNLKHFRQRNLV